MRWRVNDARVAKRAPRSVATTVKRWNRASVTKTACARCGMRKTSALSSFHNTVSPGSKAHVSME
jgi:hypothetical protein